MQAYHEIILERSPLDIRIAFRTKAGGYSPPHWHEALEILYPLNGESDIFIEGLSFRQKSRHLTVVDSGKVHSTFHYGENAMFLCIHVIKKSLEWYLPKIQNYQIECRPDLISDDKFPIYLELCGYLKQITELYISDSPTFPLEAEGLILQLLSGLILHFSTDTAPLVRNSDKLSMDRIRQIIDYVEAHFSENISLQDMADFLGLRKEYFCRFFRKNMGFSFFDYVHQVRATHIYQDLIHTEDPVSVLMEKNGFTNQKLFNRTFKELYGCTPMQVRKMQSPEG